MMQATWKLATRLAVAALTFTALGCGSPEFGASLPQAPAGISQAASLGAEENEPEWKAPKEPLGHFFKVDDGLYRGQQPADQGFEQLAAMGVKTVVYLHFNKKQAAHEKQVVEKLGMRFVHLPMSWITPPTDKTVDQWLKVATDPVARPVFVHCQHGRDRTGTMVGIYRIKQDGWKFDQAYQEMKEKGFRTFFLGLTHGVKRFEKRHLAERPAPQAAAAF